MTLANLSSAAVGKLVPVLLAVMTAAAGAIVVLAFQQWVDFGITEISGTDADAATGISDGWFVAGFGSAVLLFIGGIQLRPQWSQVLLPAIAFASVCALLIAGFDTVTNWTAAGFDEENPQILTQANGDPTAVPYVTAGLAILIALSAAILRGVQLGEGQSQLAEPTFD